MYNEYVHVCVVNASISQCFGTLSNSMYVMDTQIPFTNTMLLPNIGIKSAYSTQSLPYSCSINKVILCDVYQINCDTIIINFPALIAQQSSS